MTGIEVDNLQIVRPAIPLRELAADTLREAILSGAFPPGARLVEPMLAKRMGVSRPSIREALSQLSAEKLVVLIPNKGFSVASIDWDEAKEIYHVRSLIEGEAAFLYATRTCPEDLDRMQKALCDFKHAIQSGDHTGLLQSTSEFYKVFLDGCGNRTLVDMLSGIIARISALRARSMSRPGRANHSLSEMSALLKAFKSGDAEGARAASHSHVRAAAAAAQESFLELAHRKQAN